MEIKKVAIIGAGNMGHGIARTTAVHGFEVVLIDENQEALERGVSTIKNELKRYFVDKEKMTENEYNAIINRIHAGANLEDAVSEVDVVIEAVFEDLDLKKRLFATIDKYCPPHTIFGSNTSTLSITAMGSATQRADKVIAMHFFNPPDVNPLVEIAPGLETSLETIKTTFKFMEMMGKKPMQVKDTPSFVVNRFINALYLEAARTVQNGIATADMIDFGVKTALGFRLGPCEMMDYTGLELIAHGVGKLPGFEDLYLLRRMVDGGRYGRKNGKGFYDYSPDGSKKVADLSYIAGK